MINLIDIHAHLDQIENIAEVLAQAQTSGVEEIIAVGVDLASSKKNLEIRKRFSNPKIHVGFGIHPGDIKPAEIDSALAFFEEHIGDAVAVGEIGLDFWYRHVRKDTEKKNEQREIFRRQLGLAKKHNLPVIIHSRGAWAECLEQLKSQGLMRAVFHWYSGPVDVLKGILDAGFFISVTPALAYSPQLREAVKYAPIERVMIETDCPVFFRAGENDPGFSATPQDVFRTLDEYALLQNMDREKAAVIFCQNARTFFGIK